MQSELLLNCNLTASLVATVDPSLSLLFCECFKCVRDSLHRLFVQTHPKVALQLKLYIKSWAENEFKSSSSLR